MAIPSFARFPPKALWDQLLPEEWEACLDSWIFLVKAYLMLSNKVFNMNLSKDNSLPEFLISYLQQNSNTEKHSLNSLERIRLLHSNVFLLIHRALTHADPRPLLLLEASFLEDLSLAYSGHLHLRELIAKTWTSRKLDNSKSFLERKQSLTRMLEESGRITSSEEVEDALHRTASLVKALYLYGQFLMVGSDFLDSLVTCYEHQASALQKKVVITAYLCLSSLMQVENPKISTLIDHLYSLKNASGQSILLKEICSSTPFLRKFRDRLSGSEASRAQSMLQQLGAFEKTANGKTKKPIRRRTVKGKSRAIEDLGYGASHDVHIHKMSMITQIQDLFPHLGSAFIVKLLEEYKDSIEQVTAHVLEDSLPTYLKQADHSENLSQSHIPDEQPPDLVPELEPHSTPDLAPQPDHDRSTTRRTIFDDDAFSNLTISPSQVHYGRASNTTQTADTLLSAPSSKSNKAAILSALAAFDSDDDERDDTYDAADVGGTIDTAFPGTSDDAMDAEALKQDQHEETLFQAWKMSPQLFARDPTTRRSQARAALRIDTGMTDEAIEGWAIMLQRDPGRLRRLEAKDSVAGVGQQRTLARTAWGSTPATSGTDEGDTEEDAGPANAPSNASRGSGRGGRGRGRGRGGRGGNVAGPSDDKGTQVARQRKDVNKGSKANHNRRDQRARKMARAGMPG